MKSRFISIVLAFVGFLVLPLALPAVAVAADNASDVKLSPQFQKMVDNAPPEQREKLRQNFIEAQKQQEQIRTAMKKFMPRVMARLPKLLEKMTSDDENSSSGMFLMDAENQQEFRDYIGIDKELAEKIRNKQMEMSINKLPETMLKIAQASTDDEVDKFVDEMVEERHNFQKERAAIVMKELNPQQIKKFNELRMINSSTNANPEPFDFGQYESLDLTDEQQKKISAIRAEYLVAAAPLLNKMFAVLQRQMAHRFEMMESPDNQNPEDIKKQEENIRKEMTEAQQPMIKLNAATRARILVLFTKEQTAKLEKVLNNAPKYLAERVGLIKAGESNGEWKPGPNSWKPGDGPIKPAEPKPQTPRKQFPLFE